MEVHWRPRLHSICRFPPGSAIGTTPTAQRAYTYDSVDRLTGVSNFEAPVESYSYDAAGNRTASHLSASYGYQPFNRLTSTASATYSYDNNGNLVSKTDTSGTTGYTFNEENQLTQVTLPSGLIVNYKYDALGRRIQRTTTAAANERYVYDNSDILIDLNADWSVGTTYLNGLIPDEHLRQTSTTTGVSYFLGDHLDSIKALADSAGNLIEQVDFDSFGNGVGSSRTRFAFTGRERDADTNQYYYRARFSDPQLGRFISEDPLQFGGGLNWYSYVENSPVDNSDPFGLQRLPYSKTKTRPCNAGEMETCKKMCGSKGVQSCRVSQTWRMVRWIAEYKKGLYKWLDGPLSCSCNDCEEKGKVPVPVPNPSRTRLDQPTMDELRMQEESARQMEQLWWKVTLGGRWVLVQAH